MDAFAELFELIGTLARQRFQAAENHFAKLGIGHTEARLLSLLKHEGGAATQDVLSVRLHIDRSNAGRALKRLEDTGYITRQKQATDKRTNMVRVTPAGEAMMADIANVRQQIIAGFFGDMQDRDAKQAAEILRQAVR